MPFTNALDLSPTLTDILIFTSVLIVGYMVLTLLNRLILGLLNADKTGPINRLFGLVFGIIRGYILVVIIFSVLTEKPCKYTFLSFTTKHLLIK